MRHRHTKNAFPRRPYLTTTSVGDVVIVYFEKNPDELLARDNIESSGFRQLLLKQYDFRCRGIGKKHYQKLLEIKLQWETGGMSPPQYVPAQGFLTLGRVLDLSRDEVEFRHKDHTAYPQFR